MILRLLVEGMSMRSITRTVGCSINTVTKLQEEAASTLSDFQDERLRNLPCTRLEVDEIWAFVYAKQKNVEFAQGSAARRWRRVDLDGDLRRHEAAGVVDGGRPLRGPACAASPAIPTTSPRSVCGPPSTCSPSPPQASGCTGPPSAASASPCRLQVPGLPGPTRRQRRR